jgi:aldose 1-epimerase
MVLIVITDSQPDNHILMKYTYFLFCLMVVVFSACNHGKKNTFPIQSGIRENPFGKIGDTAIMRYTITNDNGMQVSIINYGATITSIIVPNKKGELGDVVLGFDSLFGYLQSTNPYFGSTIGRYGNRIAEGQFLLAGTNYSLSVNDHGNTLHGGVKGLDKVIWNATRIPGDSGMRFTYVSAAGDQGFPGELTISVHFTLTNKNTLQIEYVANTTQPTPVNLTNHTYFNLSAGASPTILDHTVTILANQYTAVDSILIPTGALPAVSGTPMDFTQPKKIGAEIAALKGGYDHNWVLNKAADSLEKVAEVFEATSGRVMEVFTTEPGLQFYTGNFLNGTLTGKAGKQYPKHAAFCMETQHFPDSPHQPSFPSTLLLPDQTYHQITQYKFTIR